jgi:hypothetical protein
MKLKSVTCCLLAIIVVLGALLPGQSAATAVATGVPPLATAYSSQRKIVADASGNLYVVYLGLPQRKDELNYTQVYLSKSEDNGTTWRILGQVSSGPYDSERATVIIDANERLHIFWTKFVGEHEYGQIFYRVYDHGHFSTEQQLTSSAAYSGYPSAAFDSKGRIHLVWYGYDGIAYQVFYSKYDTGNWSSPIRLSQGYPDSLNPTVAVDSSDNLYVAWYKSNGRNYEINFVRWAGAWEDHAVLSYGRNDSVDPTTAIDSENNLYVVWSQGDGTHNQIYFRERSEGKWSSPVAITSGDLGSEAPSIGVEGIAGLYVMYAKGDGQIYMNNLRAGVWSGEQRVTSAGFNSYPSVRWSYYYDSLNGKPERQDYVWTSLVGTVNSVQYGWVATSNFSSAEAGNAAGPSYLLAGMAIAGISVLIIIYKRPWPKS